MLVYKFSSPSQRGVPDLIVIRPSGRVFFIEMKSPTGKGKLSALQQHTIVQMRKQNVTVYVVDDKMSAEYVIEKESD